MRRRALTLPPTALLVLLLVAAPARAQVAPEVERIAGANRIETAIAISVDAYGPQSASAAVLALSDGFADALAGGPLAAAKAGPILLTPQAELAPVVAQELQRVLPDGRTVYILGGEVALSARVEDQVEALGYVARRLPGANRYATSLAIAREAAATPGFITIATGEEFPDALIAGSLAAAFRDGVTVLTAGERLPDDVRAYLDQHADVAATTVGPAAAAARPSVFNVAGATPSERSVAAAEAFYADLAPTGVAVASVEAFPDGLAGAPHAYAQGALPLLLTPSRDLPQRLADYAASLDASGPSFVYGGSLAVSDGVAAELEAALRR